MTVVMTLLVRDEADIVDAQIAYHLNAGIDFFIATDHESVDGTTEILESYARDGHLLRLEETGIVDEITWRSRMARIAASEYGATWVINTDADEFWMPTQGTLPDVLQAVPEPYGAVGAVICHFIPRPDDGRPLFERMTVRLRPPAPINDPVSPWRPSPKVAHRGDPDVTVLHAGYWIEESGRLREIQGWRPFEVFHFPCRSVEQWARKTARRGHAESDAPLGQYVKGLRAQERGGIDALYDSLVVDEEELQEGVASGLLVVDTRLRDALRSQGESVQSESGRLGAPRVSAGHDRGAIQPPVDAAALQEATVVRLQRRIDEATVRIARIERAGSRHFLPRVLRMRRAPTRQARST